MIIVGRHVGRGLPVIAPSFGDEGISVGLEMEKMEKRREGKEGSRSSWAGTAEYIRNSLARDHDDSPLVSPSHDNLRLRKAGACTVSTGWWLPYLDPARYSKLQDLKLPHQVIHPG